jgi:enoyl-CoA hydratase
MSHDSVAYELLDGVAVITLDDGRANAMSSAVVEALDRARVRAEEEAKAVVLIGREGRFSAGFDLKEMMAGPDSARQLVTAGAQFMVNVFMSPVPWVAACTGHAVAGGAITLMACDRRLGAAGAFKIGLNEVAIGMRLPVFALELARFRLASTSLTDATLLAKIYDPKGAVSAGYLDIVVPPDELRASAIAEAKRLGALDRSAFHVTKRLLRGSVEEAILTTLEADLSSLA